MNIPPMSPLATPRLLLRGCASEDADAVFAAEAESIEELRPWFWWCHPAHSRERSAAWAASREEAWRRGEEFAFLIFEIKSDMLIGCVWLNEIDIAAGRGSLGYWLRTGYAGHGFASEASRAVVDWAFNVGFTRIEIVAAVENKRSQRMVEGLGARAEGVATGRLRVGDKVQDACVYTLVRPLALER